MPTLKELSESKLLRKVQGVLAIDEDPKRDLYVGNEAYDWLCHNVQSAAADGYIDGALSPKEQLRDVFRRFISGDDFEDDPFFPKPLDEPDNTIWELRTADLRLFGWFYRQREFVISSASFKKSLAEGSLTYSGFVEQTKFYREQLLLDPPIYVSGDRDDILRL